MADTALNNHFDRHLLDLRTSTRFYYIFGAVFKDFWISISVRYTPLQEGVLVKES